MKHFGDESAVRPTFSTFRFVCRACKYGGLIRIQDSIIATRKKTNKPIVMKDDVVVSEACWQCDYKKQ